MMWLDKRDVPMISTYHGDVKNPYEKRCKKSAAIMDYNGVKKGIDIADQRLSQATE